MLELLSVVEKFVASLLGLLPIVAVLLLLLLLVVVVVGVAFVVVVVVVVVEVGRCSMGDDGDMMDDGA